MPRHVRYGDFLREATLHEQEVSYNHLTPVPARDAEGNDLPWKPAPVDLRAKDVSRLLAPYIGIRLADQLRAVVPLGLYLALFQVLILRQPLAESLTVAGGMTAVILGLMLFMEGLRLGLMPFAEAIGDQLPRRLGLSAVLFIAFTLGVGVTFAEPAIGALQTVGSLVAPERAPYLYALLNLWTTPLVLVVGGGVGLAAVAGTLRLLYSWSLKPFLYISLLPTLALTVYCALDTDLRMLIGLAWDCGGVTTGPVTVPLVLALGIGIAASAGRGDSSLSGFGIVTLASIFPVAGVLLLGLVLKTLFSPDEILLMIKAGASAAADKSWIDSPPWQDVRNGLQAIVPLVLFLFLLLKGVLKHNLKERGIVLYGLVLCQLGMIVFNLGLTYGLAKLGGQAGGLLPASFFAIEGLTGTPLYPYAAGLSIALGFAFVLGFGATLAEPALNALGLTVEDLTNGAFRKSFLMYAVSTGVALGIGFGVWKMVAGIDLVWLLIPAYVIALLLTLLSDEEFVNIAWDSAGVTTGPVTVPLVLAMGVGLGDALKASEGFGILALASIGPILTVLLSGLWVRQISRKTESDLQNAETRG